MKKGKKFYNLLSSKEKKEFKENVDDFNSEMERTEIDFYNFLLGSFTWHKTKQGFEYWSNVSKKYF